MNTLYIALSVLGVLLLLLLDCINSWRVTVSLYDSLLRPWVRERPDYVRGQSEYTEWLLECGGRQDYSEQRWLQPEGRAFRLGWRDKRRQLSRERHRSHEGPALEELGDILPDAFEFQHRPQPSTRYHGRVERDDSGCQVPDMRDSDHHDISDGTGDGGDGGDGG